MGSLGTMLRYPDDIYPLLKMKRAIEKAEKQIPPEPHWGFCYSMLHKVSRSFSLVIQQLNTELRNAVCVFYLVLRALDTVEDDTSIPTDEKVPILIAFHRHIYDTDWHYSCKSEESLNIFIFHIPLIFDCLTDKFYLFNFRWYEGVQDSNGPISPCFCSFFGT
jgi:farnesyl-diphosphate farnesyltransferase